MVFAQIDLDPIADLLGLVVGFLDSMGVLELFQVGLGAMVIIATVGWLFRYVSGTR